MGKIQGNLPLIKVGNLNLAINETEVFGAIQNLTNVNRL